ncbi:MAG: septum formation initiator family protein [Saprospiraceae bacterium]|nr:septum formation initiator family protein [Saprospiraceae bacterium]
MKTLSLIRMWFARLRQTRWLSKYTIAFSIFLVWMIFFDKHNLIVQYRLQQTLNQMEKQVDRYAEELAAAEREQRELEMYNERYAREKYFMHKPDEEVFVIVRE